MFKQSLPIADARDEQIILAVDESGKFLRYIPKEDGHRGEGIHHLAITVFIFNSKGKILLQKRKHKVFDNFWDNTASTHQLHLEDHDETDEEATLRTLEREYGIKQSLRPNGLKNIELKNLGGFNYFERIGDLCENEFCKLLIGTYDGEIKLNPDIGYSYRWISKKDFLKELQEKPEEFTPWCKAAAKILQEKGIL